MMIPHTTTAAAVIIHNFIQIIVEKIAYYIIKQWEITGSEFQFKDQVKI